MEKDYPFQVKPVLRAEYEEDPETKNVHHLFNNFSQGLERYGPQGFVVRAGQQAVMEKIYKMEVTKKDVWVVTYSRSGTTWTQEMIWNLVNSVQLEEAKKTDIDEKFLFIDDDFLRGSNYIEEAKAQIGQQRLIKTHLPLGLLPSDLLSKAKVVYVAISCFHMNRLIKRVDPSLTLEEFLPFFMKELLEEDPYLAHIKEAVQLSRSSPSLLFLWYEDMKRDLSGAIMQVANFLGVNLDKEQVEKLATHLDFSNMKNNTTVNRQHKLDSGSFWAGESFIRKGKAGGWKETLTEAANTKFDQWLKENTKDVNIDFKWD